MTIHCKRKEEANVLEKIIRENGCDIKNFKWEKTDCDRPTVLVSHMEYARMFCSLNEKKWCHLSGHYTFCTKISNNIKKECGWH